MSLDLLDPPAPTMSESESSRRRVHLLRELEPAPARRPRIAIGRKVALTVALAALIAALASTLPGLLGHGQMTLVDQALAAIGKGPTIHVVLDEGQTTELVDLHTGETRLLRSGAEVWSDPKLGTLWVSTLDGKQNQRLFAPSSKNAPIFAWWQTLLTDYRSLLQSGAFHSAGTGRVAGQPVDWIAGKPVDYPGLGEDVQEIAISQATHKPVYLRERLDGAIRPDSGIRIVTVETLPRKPALFAHRTAPFGPGLSGTSRGGTGIPTTLRAARAAMNPDPFVPAARIAKLRRSWIGMPDYLAPPYNSYRDQIGGVRLYYGRLDGTGHPGYRHSYISITEFPRPNAVVNFNGLSLFREGAAILTTHGDTIATMKTHGLYVIIQAATRADALAAARELAH